MAWTDVSSNADNRDVSSLLPTRCERCDAVVDMSLMRRPDVPYAGDFLFCPACAGEIETSYAAE